MERFRLYCFQRNIRGERFKFEHKGFLFLGFNSGPLMRMAYGMSYREISHWMTETMKWIQCRQFQAGQTCNPCYPLSDEDGDVDNWYDVTDAVRPYNIRTFIGGHYHRNRALRMTAYQVFLMRSNLRDKNG